MSLIMAIKKDGVVYLGADTRSTRGHFIESIKTDEDQKICRLGDLYVGCAGSVSHIQLMLSHPEWFDTHGKPLTKKFLVQNVVGKYYDELMSTGKLNENGGSKNGVTQPPESGGTFIVTDGNGIFFIDCDFEVVTIRSCIAIGCTKPLAMAYMLTGECDDPEATMLSALRESSLRNNGVGAPYILVNTRDNKFVTVEV